MIKETDNTISNPVKMEQVMELIDYLKENDVRVTISDEIYRIHPNVVFRHEMSPYTDDDYFKDPEPTVIIFSNYTLDHTYRVLKDAKWYVDGRKKYLRTLQPNIDISYLKKYIEPTKTKLSDLEVGDLVWLDGYTSMSQSNSQEKCEIKEIEYRYDELTGLKYTIFYVNGKWWDSRDGGCYDNPESMYFIELIN